MNLSYIFLTFLLSTTAPSNGHQLLRGKLILDQIKDTNFLAEDGAQDTLSLLEGCEQVLVVVRHGKDGDQQSFPADVPDHIQDVHAEYYALNDVGHATAMFLRDHLDPFLESNNYCAVTKAEVVRPWNGNTSNPLTTLSPWAANHGDVKYKFVANDDQNDDGAHSNNVGSSTMGTRLIVSTGKGLWATKDSSGHYPRINNERVLAKMLKGSSDDFCFLLTARISSTSTVTSRVMVCGVT